MQGGGKESYPGGVSIKYPIGSNKYSMWGVGTLDQYLICCVIRGADKVGVPVMCNWGILNGGGGLGDFKITLCRVNGGSNDCIYIQGCG